MIIDVFAIAWNEERQLDQFLDWYSFADKITILDNHSTDNTATIAKTRGCEVVEWGGNKQDNREMRDIKEKCWKGSKADWVIVCDIDEYLYHPEFTTILEQTKATVVRSEGYQMVSETHELNKDIKFGARERLVYKCICFRPNRITRMNWGYGCHNCSPWGQVEYLKDSIKLLHFHYNGREALQKRYEEYRTRIGDWDLEHGAGIHYMFDEKKFNEIFDMYLNRKEKVW